MDNRYIIVFDGVCNFCNGIVHFIIKRDPKRLFVFTPLQGDTAKYLMLKYQVSASGSNTILLIKDGICYIRSNAVLEIAKDSTGFWHFFRILLILPVPIRDYCYKLFAQNRYKLFGKRESCMPPTVEIRDRYIE